MPYSIGEIAKQGGVAASAIRYYEKLGMIPKAERQGGKRRFSDEALQQLDVVTSAQGVGFSLAEIKILLGGISKRGGFQERLQKLAIKKLPEVNEMLTRAALMKRILESAEKCRCLDLGQCVSEIKKTSGKEGCC